MVTMPGLPTPYIPNPIAPATPPPANINANIVPQNGVGGGNQLSMPTPPTPTIPAPPYNQLPPAITATNPNAGNVEGMALNGGGVTNKQQVSNFMTALNGVNAGGNNAFMNTAPPQQNAQTPLVTLPAPVATNGALPSTADPTAPLVKNPSTEFVNNQGPTSGYGMNLVSDENLKTDIQSSDKSLDKFINTIGTYQYRYKDESDGKGTFFGPMAQELEKTPVGKSAVIETPRGKMVDTGRLSLINTSALSIVHKQNQQLQAQVNQLRKQFSLIGKK